MIIDFLDNLTWLFIFVKLKITKYFFPNTFAPIGISFLMKNIFSWYSAFYLNSLSFKMFLTTKWAAMRMVACVFAFLAKTMTLALSAPFFLLKTSIISSILHFLIFLYSYFSFREIITFWSRPSPAYEMTGFLIFLSSPTLFLPLGFLSG